MPHGIYSTKRLYATWDISNEMSYVTWDIFYEMSYVTWDIFYELPLCYMEYILENVLKGNEYTFMEGNLSTLFCSVFLKGVYCKRQ